MKNKFLLLLFVLVIQANSLLAFDLDNYPFSAGLSIAGKMGVNAANVPDGLQNSLSFLKGVDVAATVYLPMADDSKTGIFVELGYTNTPFGLKQYGTNATSFMNQKWLTVSPIVLMYGITLGLEFGFDAFGDAVDEKYVMFGFTPRKPDFNVNLRVGFMQPLMSKPLGTLNFIINGTYNITGSDYWGDYTYNPATISLGLNFLFNLETSAEY